jgi:uncharacterized membrane protein
MKRMIEFLKTTLLGGALVIAPVAAIVLLLAKVAQILRHVLEPIASKLPADVRFPYVIEVVSVIVVCFIAGLLIRTGPGRWIGGLIEARVFERIPGYALFKALTGRSLAGPTDQGAIPALVDMEEGLVPALIIERHADGYVTVFVPSPPVPTVGQVYVFDSSKVHPVDVTLPKFVSCITKWGLGSQELRLAMRRD